MQCWLTDKIVVSQLLFRRENPFRFMWWRFRSCHLCETPGCPPWCVSCTQSTRMSRGGAISVAALLYWSAPTRRWQSSPWPKWRHTSPRSRKSEPADSCASWHFHGSLLSSGDVKAKQLEQQFLKSPYYIYNFSFSRLRAEMKFYMTNLTSALVNLALREAGDCHMTRCDRHMTGQPSGSRPTAQHRDNQPK